MSILDNDALQMTSLTQYGLSSLASLISQRAYIVIFTFEVPQLYSGWITALSIPRTFDIGSRPMHVCPQSQRNTDWNFGSIVFDSDNYYCCNILIRSSKAVVLMLQMNVLERILSNSSVDAGMWSSSVTFWICVPSMRLLFNLFSILFGTVEWKLYRWRLFLLKLGNALDRAAAYHEDEINSQFWDPFTDSSRQVQKRDLCTR